MTMERMMFLNANFYKDKQGQHRCYAQFASYATGEVTSFDARVWAVGAEPQRFMVCDVKCEMQQYGRNVNFVLTDYVPIAPAVAALDEKGGK